MMGEKINRETRVKVAIVSISLVILMQTVPNGVFFPEDSVLGYYNVESGEIWVDPSLSDHMEQQVRYHEELHRWFYSNFSWFGDISIFIGYFGVFLVFYVSILFYLAYLKKIKIDVSLLGSLLGVVMLIEGIPEYHAYLFTYLEFHDLSVFINVIQYILVPVFGLFFISRFDFTENDEEPFKDISGKSSWP